MIRAEPLENGILNCAWTRATKTARAKPHSSRLLGSVEVCLLCIALAVLLVLSAPTFMDHRRVALNAQMLKLMARNYNEMRSIGAACTGEYIIHYTQAGMTHFTCHAVWDTGVPGPSMDVWPLSSPG